jgi:hypothetical protein
MSAKDISANFGPASPRTSEVAGFSTFTVRDEGLFAVENSGESGDDKFVVVYGASVHDLPTNPSARISLAEFSES